MTAQSDPESSEKTTVVTSSDDPTQLAHAESETSELRPGDILRERFVIERLLGEGGMGQVFLAVDREAEKSNPHVALKMLGESFKRHPQSLKALRREASQSQRMNHPNIVNVFFFERTEQHVFMVMEYMRGDSLDIFLERNPEGSKLATVWPIIEASAEGLKYIHKQRIIHSDFKPSNVFVTEEGEIKVLDLGIARSLDELNASDGTTRFDPDALGALTPSYASCEMFEGLSPTAQDDLFALACVIYELLTGRHPYQRKSALEARAEALQPARPRGLKNRQWRVLKSCLAFARSDRPADVSEFLGDFAPERGGVARMPWVVATSAAIGVAVIVGIYSFIVYRDADDLFIQSSLTQYASGSDLVPLTRAQDWLDQGIFFGNLGDDSLQNAQYDKGIAQLLTAPSSSFQSYRLALTRSDDAAVRQAAAQGMLRIANSFKNAALLLAENPASDPALVAKSVCSGLEVNQRDEELLAVLASLKQKMVTNSVTECRQLIVSGRVTL